MPKLADQDEELGKYFLLIEDLLLVILKSDHANLKGEAFQAYKQIFAQFIKVDLEDMVGYLNDLNRLLLLILPDS
jgi:hypothetical protein